MISASRTKSSGGIERLLVEQLAQLALDLVRRGLGGPFHPPPPGRLSPEGSTRTRRGARRAPPPGTVTAAAGADRRVAAPVRARPPPSLSPGSLCAEAGLGADVQLVELALGRRLAAQHRAEPTADEAERDRHDARVGQVVEPEGPALGVRAGPDLRADDDEQHRAEHAGEHADDRARRVEPPPGEASSSAGKLALAATAKARPTMNDTFRPAPPMTAMAIAIAPIATAAIFATQTSSFSESRPSRTTFDQMSCATAPDAEITRPATTARIVANATPAMIARNRSPPSSLREVRQRRGCRPCPPPPPRPCRGSRGRRTRGTWSSGRRRRSAPSPRSRTTARRLGVRDREEAHQDVRQARRAEHQGQPERDRVERRRQEEARLEVLLALGRLPAARP